jgi:multiple sugar transport system permease protein/putative aldouronate transport system permease protein
VNGFLLTVIMVLTLYPILCVISSAVSNPSAVYSGKVTFYPIGFSLRGFEINFQNRNVISGFLNSVFYTVFGTLLNVFATMISGYALSRRELIGWRPISFFFAFTMWFSGGLIPFYLLVRDLGMYNSRLALIIPGMVSVWNIIIVRTYIRTTIPDEMFEAASIDGCGYFRFLWQVVLPLSGAIIAVITLWVVIGHWNAYFNALIFINDKSKKPLQLFLRDYLISAVTPDMSDVDFTTESLGIQELVKNALILIACLPLWIIYPFVQKYFVKGVMIGSLKG